MDADSLEGLADGDLARLLSGADADSAFTALYHRYAGRVFDFVVRTVHDPAAAENITQTAFVRAWRQRWTLQDPEAVRAWLYGIATGLALNGATHRRATNDMDGQAAVLDASVGGPEEHALSVDAARLVWAAAARLEPRQHAVLELALRQQLSHAEIATVMSLEPAQVPELVQRAREALAGAVRDLGVTTPDELLAALLPLPLPERLQTPPHLLMRPAGAASTETTSGTERRVAVTPPAPQPARPERRRGRRAALVALLVGVLVAGGGVALVSVLSHPKTTGSTAATVIIPGGSGQPAASNQQVTPGPLFETPTADAAVPQTPAPTAAPTTPPTATPGPTLPPLAVTGISICFVNAQGNCDAGTTVPGCTPSGAASGDVCSYKLTFQLAAGAGGTIDWSLSGTVSYCVLGTPAVASKSFGPTTGSVSVPFRPSDTAITTPEQSLSLDVDPARHTTSTATVTSPEGGSSSGTTTFYGTASC